MINEIKVRKLGTSISKYSLSEIFKTLLNELSEIKSNYKNSEDKTEML